ncbi:dipeptidyl aminopeptidase/acylaminoacyl peptidase [Catalinimonas alkaloidigena]|uniref:S9 family peptidase n=1 Tax=Catalinimonas alkaloidigena TaxID=1075417 RepID=UPI0024071746|nr:prolyl oligopeptidase family serine peptidase [Catalinimonas alkaloidigena]MDF9796990.1 dipeptidyl aminopeptidase/acylaminoacyl peptidase [Catalinimonas alkaloidigena]
MKNTLALMLCLTAGGLWAQNNEPDENRWTPEDIINTERMQEVQISPNEQMVVWTKEKGEKEKDKFVSDIYLTRLDVQKDGEYLTIPMTNGDEDDYSPLFSQDSETLYFLSSREKGKKLWSMSIYGGEPKEVHEFENGISDINLLNDSTLTFTSNDGKTLYEQKLEEKKDNTIIVEDTVHWTNQKVYAFNLKDKSIKRLTDNEHPVSQYAISRDGRWMITGLTMSPHYASDAQPKGEYYLYDLESGEKTKVLENLQTPGNFKFTSDHQGFYFTAEHSSDPEWNGAGITELYYYLLDEQAYDKVDLDWEWGLGGDFALTSDGLLAHLAHGATRKLAYFQKDESSWSQQLITLNGMEQHLSFFETSKDGKKLVFDYSTASKLPKYYVADIQHKRNKAVVANYDELVKLNQKLQKKPIARAEIFRWQGYNDEEVNGILIYPENYEEGKKYPLVLSIHGGPSGVDLDLWTERWSTYPNIMSQRGAFVLKPNYHGSSNHGLAFVESIKKNYYEPELVDIMNAVDELVDKGLVDEDKLGVMGWSNGAILTTMLTVRYPDKFKVAAPGAGDVNWTSDFGTCRFGVSFDQSYFGGAPWDDVNGKFYNENYIIKSPLFEMEKVKTPTIIFHGSEDRAVPRDQGWEYYRALQQNDKAPVRFVWFPDQPHGLKKITHQLRKMNEELDWFDQYLFKNYEKKNEALKSESPIAMLLKKEKVAKEGALYGKLYQDKLIPEVVSLGEDTISLGRFEVTNAQYQAYKTDHKFDPTESNFALHNVSKGEAEAYLAWLSELTGESYRLPNVKEATKWHELGRKNAEKENTLNFWAGFDITLEEVSLLQEKIDEAKPLLLKAVGSHPPLKLEKAEVYDLGGNVSEYHSEGETYGYSAYDYADPSNVEVHSDQAYRGFRIVKESQ